MWQHDKPVAPAVVPPPCGQGFLLHLTDMVLGRHCVSSLAWIWLSLSGLKNNWPQLWTTSCEVEVAPDCCSTTFHHESFSHFYQLKISGNQSYESSPESGPQHYRSSVGVILTENGTKSSQHTKKSFQEAWRTIPERNDKTACLRGFRLCWRIKAVTPNIDFYAS